VDLTFYKDLAQTSGLYFSASSTIDLSKFTVDGDRASNPGASVYYNGSLVGHIHEPPEEDDFSGIIYVNGDASVQGSLSGLPVTVVASDDLVIANSITTGCTREEQDSLDPPIDFNKPAGTEQIETVSLDSLIGSTANEVKVRVSGTKWSRVTMYLKQDGQTIGVSTLERVSGSAEAQAVTVNGLDLDTSQHSYTAELHYLSTGTGASPVSVEVGSGDPINIGLVAKDMVYIKETAPRVLSVDAAILARDNTWDALGTSSQHPACHGVWDLDGDGVIETVNEDGWNEGNVGTSTWMLTIRGPIVTHSGGDAGIWSDMGDSTHNTRQYKYDGDIVEHQPPAFPVTLDRWASTYWREIMPGPVSGAVSSAPR
jgi:hypothetical protein